MGYWPSSLFDKLNYSASSVAWGGEVFAPPVAGITSTQMGSGHLPSEGYGKASYIRNIWVVDSNNYHEVPSHVGLIAMKPNCYNVMNGASSSWGTYIYHGGPGKNTKWSGMSFTEDEYPIVM